MTRRALLAAASALLSFQEQSRAVLRSSPLKNMRAPFPVHAHGGLTTVIDGFWHSGNTFLGTNIEDPNAVLMHRHTPEVLRWGKTHGLQTLALIRDPYTTVASLVNRGEAEADEALNLWTAYYRECRAVDGIGFLSFHSMTTSWATFRADFVGPRLREAPVFSGQHKFTGDPVSFTPRAELLREAEKLYADCL